MEESEALFNCVGNAAISLTKVTGRARGRPKRNWMEGISKAMNERNLMKASGKIGSNGV